MIYGASWKSNCGQHRLINYGFNRLTRKILSDFPQVWVLFAKLVAQSTPQLIAEGRCGALKPIIANEKMDF